MCSVILSDAWTGKPGAWLLLRVGSIQCLGESLCYCFTCVQVYNGSNGPSVNSLVFIIFSSFVSLQTVVTVFALLLHTVLLRGFSG